MTFDPEFEAAWKNQKQVSDYCKPVAWAMWQAALGFRVSAEKKPTLAVWYGPMPESNGKSNWTAILHNGDISEGVTLDRSEYPDRVRYEADRVRYLIGELDKQPWILDYDADKHSGYVTHPTPDNQRTQRGIGG